MWRDDRAVSNILEEFIALAVVLLALGLLLVSLYVRHEAEVESLAALEMREETRGLLERVVTDPTLTREGEYLMLEHANLANLTAESLAGILDTDYGFQLVIHDVSNSSDRVIQTSPPAGDAIGSTTSCNIWVRPGDVHAARISILTWRP